METKKNTYNLPSGGQVSFSWPLLQPEQLMSGRIRDARKRRKWRLAKDWLVCLSGTKKLNGTIVVEEGTVVDGASISLPWLIAFLTGGILRPNGILLVPAIVHDCLYERGEATLKRAGPNKTVAVSREDADWLFREMIHGINDAGDTASHLATIAVKVCARMAWLAVHIFGGSHYGPSDTE